MDEAINDIFSLAVISNESFEDAKISIGNCLDDLFYEMDDRRRAEQVKLKLFDVYQPIFGAGHAEV
jgi:predicted proteasome-type protease